MLTKAAEEYSKNFNIMKNYYNLIYLNVLMLSRLNFQHHYFSLQCHVILQKSF